MYILYNSNIYFGSINDYLIWEPNLKAFLGLNERARERDHILHTFQCIFPSHFYSFQWLSHTWKSQWYNSQTVKTKKRCCFKVLTSTDRAQHTKSIEMSTLSTPGDKALCVIPRLWDPRTGFNRGQRKYHWTTSCDGRWIALPQLPMLRAGSPVKGVLPLGHNTIQYKHIKQRNIAS